MIPSTLHFFCKICLANLVALLFNKNFRISLSTLRKKKSCLDLCVCVCVYVWYWGWYPEPHAYLENALPLEPCSQSHDCILIGFALNLYIGNNRCHYYVESIESMIYFRSLIYFIALCNLHYTSNVNVLLDKYLCLQFL